MTYRQTAPARRAIWVLGLALGAAEFAAIQPARAGGFGPMAVFSGTWVAENPGAAALKSLE